MTVMMALYVGAEAQAGSLAIGEGTFELGGRATANIVIDGATDIYLDLSPTIGYFVTPNLELLAGVSLLLNEGAVGAAFFGGMDYVFNGKGPRPYVGAGVGYGAASFDFGPFGYQDEVVTLSGRAGGLLPLNKKVAVDLGGRLNLNFSGGASWVHIPLGYFGVRAFFP